MQEIMGSYWPAHLEKRKAEIFQNPNNTYRDIKQYAPLLGFATTEAFVLYLQHVNGDIVDLGSGYDGFAFSASIKNLGLHIISVNPSREKDSFEQDRLRNIRESYPHMKIKTIQSHLQHLDERSDFAYDLASIPSGSVALILDNLAVSLWHKLPNLENEADLFMQYLLESVRILQVNGKMLISNLAWEIPEKPGVITKRGIARILEDLGLISVNLIHTTNERVLGAEITKLKDLPLPPQ